MAGKHAFWVIVVGTTPTSFRARHPEDLLPTLKQLQNTQPDVALRWFDRGKLWESPEAALDALKAERRAAGSRQGLAAGRDTRRSPREVPDYAR